MGSSARQERLTDSSDSRTESPLTSEPRLRGHVIVVAPGNLSFPLQVSTNTNMFLEGGAERGITTERPSLRVVPGDTANGYDEDVGEGDVTQRDARTGTPAGQLPLPEAPEPVAPGPEEIADEPPEELGDMAADDDFEADIERSLDEYPEPDDVFAENSEVAFESRAERAQPDTFLTTAEGELRDASDLAPDTALVEPIVEADPSMGEEAVGGATSTPVVAEADLDPSDPIADEGDLSQKNAENPGAPFSEVTPEEFEELP